MRSSPCTSPKCGCRYRSFSCNSALPPTALVGTTTVPVLSSITTASRWAIGQILVENVGHPKDRMAICFGSCLESVVFVDVSTLVSYVLVPCYAALGVTCHTPLSITGNQANYALCRSQPEQHTPPDQHTPLHQHIPPNQHTQSAMDLELVSHGPTIDLEKLACEIPLLLEAVPAAALRSLLATSSPLREAVQGFVRRIEINKSATEAEDFELLARTSWPCLTNLCILKQKTQMAWCSNMQDWHLLTHVDLTATKLEAAGANRLCSAALPNLSSLDTAVLTQQS